MGIDREISRWNKRIWYPNIKYIGNDENKRIEDLLTDAEACNICFETKDDLYRFLDYGINRGLIRNCDVTFVRGDLFSIYVTTEYRFVDDCYKYIKELITDAIGDCKNKWVICDDLSTEFDYNSSGYLISKLVANGCRGLIYHTPKDSQINNLYECTCKKNICKTVYISDGELGGKENEKK